MKKAILTLLLLGSATMAEAQEKSGAQQPPAPPSGAEETAPSSPPPPLELAPITVTAPPPVAASSELLIPGRGFDADHGTDIALFVDGLPVNLRSHAHGQGYADLHFLIPETLRQVDTLKGPYYVEARPGHRLGIRRPHAHPARRRGVLHLLVAQSDQRARLQTVTRPRSSRAAPAAGPGSSSC